MWETTTSRTPEEARWREETHPELERTLAPLRLAENLDKIFL